MRFIRRHWYNIGLAFAMLAIVWTILGDLNTIQVILLLNFVVLMLHQFEEYA